ncbi:hypothetical protein GLA29479_358 [Lysobacter antibioticus]|uniref:HvfA family oxazolone/thioamide-modified RiPP metallophore n=1 Tax=Lysobacter antibioticus TaxID=84531 RepID=UPI000716FB58|nr:hypothetical protein [Lysobacter antibioticus]ALN61244.1 hypothetical protein GLA29479_358 [Lysobacter antibioticus]
MSTSHSRNSLVGALSIVLAGGALFGAQAMAAQPQALTGFAGIAAAEGKCGEGKCGAAKTGTSAKKAVAEGACGEGKCGDASFAKTDGNHDGKVSRAEFLAVAAGRAADFDRIDRGRDGYISEAEAHDFLKRTYQANGKPMPKGLFSQIAD